MTAPSDSLTSVLAIYINGALLWNMYADDSDRISGIS